MNSDQEYFRCVFEEILPELKSGEITIDAYQEGEDNEMNLSPILSACGIRKIFFIEGGNTLDSISIPPVAEILTHISLKRICHFSKNSGVSISTAKVLATFKECKRPAIIHEPEKNTIYLLFDLQRLVCGLSKMEIELGKADKHGRFLAAFLNDESSWKYPILDVFAELMREKSGVSGQQGTPGIVVTHDVDRVGSEPLLVLKNTIKKKEINVYHHSEKKDKLFQEIIELAKIDSQHKIKSLWFFLAGKYSLRR